MKYAHPIVVVAPLLLLSFALPGAELKFAVQEKTKLSKVFDGKANFHSTSIHMRVDGEDVDSPLGALTVNIEDDVHLELHDEYGALKGGKPVKLKRTFDKVEGKSVQHFEVAEEAGMKPPPDVKQTRASGIEGKTVLFTLGEDGEYKASFEDEKADTKLLEKLEEDMDLRALLPEKSLEADQSWDIDVPALFSVFNVPGGQLKLRAEGEPENDGKLGDEMQENVKGKAKGTYKGSREVDGHKCAVLAIEAQTASHGDRDDSARTPPGGMTGIAVEFDIEGEILWDVEAGHFHSCKLESKSKMTMKSSRKVEHNGESHEIERVTEFEGEYEFSCAVGE